MKHTKEKIKLTEGIHFYLVPETGDFCIAEIPENYESDFKMSRELLKTNAERLMRCWNEHDGLVAKIDHHKNLLASERKENHDIRNRWHIDLNDKVAYKTKADLFDELVKELGFYHAIGKLNEAVVAGSQLDMKAEALLARCNKV